MLVPHGIALSDREGGDNSNKHERSRGLPQPTTTARNNPLRSGPLPLVEIAPPRTTRPFIARVVRRSVRANVEGVPRPVTLCPVRAAQNIDPD